MNFDDVLKILAALEREDVRYAVVGSMAMAVSLLPAGWASDHFGPKVVLVWGWVAGIFCTVFFATISFAGLLPIFVRDILRMNSSVFGTLMGSLGAGAIVAAFILPSLRMRFDKTRLLAAALLVYGAMLMKTPMASPEVRFKRSSNETRSSISVLAPCHLASIT